MLKNGNIKSESLKRFFEKMKNIQVSALGAAVVAAYTVGIYETIDEAITHMVAVSEVFRPDMEIHRKYSRKYQCE